MRYPAIALLLLNVMSLSACEDEEILSPGGSTSWRIEPARLVLDVGESATLTVTIFDQRGDTLDADRMGGWTVEMGSSQLFYGSSPVSVDLPNDPRANPQRYGVRAMRPGMDTLGFALGGYSGCNDPPECMSRNWNNAAPVIRVPVVVR